MAHSNIPINLRCSVFVAIPIHGPIQLALNSPVLVRLVWGTTSPSGEKSVLSLVSTKNNPWFHFSSSINVGSRPSVSAWNNSESHYSDSHICVILSRLLTSPYFKTFQHHGQWMNEQLSVQALRSCFYASIEIPATFILSPGLQSYTDCA